MGLIKAALGLKMTDEEWRQLEARYDGSGDTELLPSQSNGKKRSWGQYKKSRDQFGGQW